MRQLNTSRKRDKRTIERIARERKARAMSASEAARIKRAELRFPLLRPLTEMHIAGLTPSEIARSFEARGVLTVTGKRYWYATTAKNLLAYFAPYFRWREMPDDTASSRFFIEHVAPLLPGLTLTDFHLAASQGDKDVLIPPSLTALQASRKHRIGLTTSTA